MAGFAFVTTNSICQGRQVALYWGAFLGNELEIKFAEPSLKWSNLAQRQAAVIVSIIGLGLIDGKHARIFNNGEQKRSNISALIWCRSLNYCSTIKALLE